MLFGAIWFARSFVVRAAKRRTTEISCRQHEVDASENSMYLDERVGLNTQREMSDDGQIRPGRSSLWTTTNSERMVT
jgi:hypothetical protein